MRSSYARSLKTLLTRPAMAGSSYSRLFHLSSNRAPQHNSNFTLNGMRRHGSSSFWSVLPRRTVNTAVSIERKPKFRVYCVKQDLRSVRPIVNNRKVHTAAATETVIREDLPRRFVSPSRSPYPVPAERENVLIERLVRLRDKLNRNGIQLTAYTVGQHGKYLCPKCRGGSSKEPSFSVHISEDGLLAEWICFRGTCGWAGKTDGLSVTRQDQKQSVQKPQKPKEPRKITEQGLDLRPLNDDLISYFQSRGISGETLRRNKVMAKMSPIGVPVIAFTYRRNDVLINCKYRELPKKFWQESDTEKILYGLDDIKSQSDIIIVEGEMDKLSLEEAGFKNCVSVPDGAPARVSNKELPGKEEDTKYQYLWGCNDYLKSASRIILATDDDAPGQALAEELARRLGKERCWRVKWPLRNNVDATVCKDANEVLVYLGVEALKEVIENAEMYPIKGLFTFRDFSQEIDNYYKGSLQTLCMSTGWQSLDKYYKVMPGELTIVSGIPNSGKSEWIDALLVNLNRSVGWKFLLCSMENAVKDHGRKLLEKRIGKPFFNTENVERMNRDELEEGKKWLDKSFYLIRCEEESLPSVKWVLQLAKAAVLRYGVRGLVIDPYNELDHQRPPNQTETEYVSQILTHIKRFAQHHSCHVWFVAHPRQLHNWNGGAPNLYDISGSAHFINKCDNGIVIHRNRDPEKGPMDRVQVLVRKVRNKVAGQIGECYLRYNWVTGEYFEDPNDES
ncbi:hypothetical protein LUZ60_017344 [Juncus effusus]|nr:hypothetical protein LUZ60_017344 [Juncus effusus]